ncbi:MAG: hypothetical protein KA339_09090, partial [Candidatus Kapabacteria bacterium]|nr:hypothetical protein [Candidatus Kapabacteria bacterium]
MYGSPPEFESCVKTPMDTFGLGAPFSVICPRRMGWSVTGSGGFLQTAKEPVANVVTSINDPDGEPLKFQPITYSFGIDASIPVSASNDIGIRGSINAQPSTIDDASMQNSLGMDQYQIQVIGTWHLLAIDDIGYNKFGMSTTFALGPSFLWYRTRTYNDFANFTSTGTGLAIDASLNIQMMYSISRAVAVGFRGTASYQLGISSSLSDITWPEPDGNQWTATFSISDQSAAYLGAQLVVSYTLP